MIPHDILPPAPVGLTPEVVRKLHELEARWRSLLAEEDRWSPAGAKLEAEKNAALIAEALAEGREAPDLVYDESLLRGRNVAKGEASRAARMRITAETCGVLEPVAAAVTTRCLELATDFQTVYTGELARWSIATGTPVGMRRYRLNRDGSETSLDAIPSSPVEPRSEFLRRHAGQVQELMADREGIARSCLAPGTLVEAVTTWPLTALGPGPSKVEKLISGMRRAVAGAATKEPIAA